MAEQIEQAARTAGRTFNISLAELAGANAGQRNDLLALNQAVYRVPEGTLYTSDGAQLVPAQGLPVTAQTNPLTGGIELTAGGASILPSLDVREVSPYYMACITGTDAEIDGRPMDITGHAASASIGASLTLDAMTATDGWLTTGVGANQALSIPTSKALLNHATESFIFSVLINAPIPGASISAFGNGNASNREGFYISLRATTGKVRPIFGSLGLYNTGLADSTLQFCDGADHVMTLMYDAFTKNAFLYRDGVLSDTYATGLLQANTSNPSSPFGLGATEGLLGVGVRFAGVHLLKMNGGLPPNRSAIARLLATQPRTPLKLTQIREVGRVVSTF